jgi:predicted PurR-regulated permease PerM
MFERPAPAAGLVIYTPSLYPPPAILRPFLPALHGTIFAKLPTVPHFLNTDRMTPTKPIPPFYTKLAMVLISLIALFYIAILGKSILAPLVFSLLFAVLLLPLANFFERRLHIPRSLASLLSVLLLVLSLLGLLYLVGSQISSLAEDWPQFKQQVLGSLNSLQHWISTKFHIRIKQQMT